MKKKKKEKKIFKKSKKPKSMPSVVFRWDHLRFTSGIICGSGSFAVQFGDHLRCGDHLRSGIICGAVQLLELKTGFCSTIGVKPVKMDVRSLSLGKD